MDASLLATATRHRLDLLLFERLVREQSAELPARTRAQANSALRAAAADNRRLLRELLRILPLLSEAGIAALPLKGPVLVWLLWGDLRLRRCRDIDILVPRGRVAEAVTVLVNAGYRAAPPAGGLVREIHLQHHADGTVVDLHWNVAFAEVGFQLDFDEVWADRQFVRWEGTLLSALGPEWLFLITCMYLVKDHPWPELIYVSDLARLIVRFPDLNWDRLAALAARTGTRRICAAGLALVDDLPGFAVPSAAHRCFPIGRAVAAVRSRLLRALANPGHDVADDPVSRLRKIWGHAAFRERLSDKMRVYACFVPLLLRPGRQRAGQQWAEASLHRLRRFGESIFDLMDDAWRGQAGKLVAGCRPTEGMSFHALDDAGLLVSAATQEIYALTSSAAFLWACLEEGMSARAMALRFATASGRSFVQARAEVGATLDTWRALRLVGSAFAASERALVDEPPARTPRPAVARHGATFALRRRYQLFSTVFEVGFANASLHERVDPAVRHLGTILPATAMVDVRGGDDGSFVVSVDGEEADRCESPRAVGPMVKGVLNATAVNRESFAFYLHAAMLQRGEEAVLLPGAPQSGKTCLSAALARAGFAYRTDEVTLLDYQGLTARGAPVALTIKQSAWPLLQPLYPEIDGLPVHHRADDKIIKYLPPPTLADPGLWHRPAKDPRGYFSATAQGCQRSS